LKGSVLAKRTIFTVTSPLGYRVSLSRDRWRQIIRYKHPALKGCERLVRECLEHPAIIRESAKVAAVHLYYRKVRGTILCVVTAPSEGAEHFVVSAYFTKNVKQGKKELWKK
jgi:hypothetical protein